MLQTLCLLSVIICLLAASGCRNSQNKLIEDQALKQLFDEDWKTREHALFTLRKLENEGYKLNEKNRKRVVALLDKETQAYEMNKQFPHGDYDDYVKTISGYVASNKIEEGFPALFRLITQTDYNLTPALLAAYADNYLNFLIDKSAQGSGKEREVALCVLAILLDTSVEGDDFVTTKIPSLNQSERIIVKPVFLKAAKDSDYNVRFVALSGLEEFISDSDVRAVIEEIARSDSEKFIRDDAREILSKHR